MIGEAALVTVSAVLFVQMGLSGAVQETIRLRSRIASCPKCLAFWSTLAYCILTGNGIVASVATSFICSYAALWLALLYDALALIYNSAYESITETNDTSKDAEAGADDTEATADEVPQM